MSRKCSKGPCAIQIRPAHRYHFSEEVFGRHSKILFAFNIFICIYFEIICFLILFGKYPQLELLSCNIRVKRLRPNAADRLGWTTYELHFGLTYEPHCIRFPFQLWLRWSVTLHPKNLFRTRCLIKINYFGQILFPIFLYCLCFDKFFTHCRVNE